MNEPAPFTQALRDLKARRRMTLAEMAVILSRPLHVVANWHRGGEVPPDPDQADVLASLEEAPPSRAESTQDFRLHGLSFDRIKRRWKIRLTVDVGESLKGHRLTLWLQGESERDAILQRDTAVTLLGRLGLKIRARPVKRRAETSSMSPPPANASAYGAGVGEDSDPD